jgi:hypothetical protein
MKKIAEEKLGHAGRLIAGSKSGYYSAYPENVPIFNSNVVVKTGAFGGTVEKIWHGDLDLTKDCQKLRKLSDAIEKPVFVITEMDGRFENEENPLINQYIAEITKDSVKIGNSWDDFYVVNTDDDNNFSVKRKNS